MTIERVVFGSVLAIIVGLAALGIYKVHEGSKSNPITSEPIVNVVKPKVPEITTPISHIFVNGTVRLCARNPVTPGWLFPLRASAKWSASRGKTSKTFPRVKAGTLFFCATYKAPKSPGWDTVHFMILYDGKPTLSQNHLRFKVFKDEF